MGFTVTRHALIAVLFCMASSAFVVAVLADSLALKAAREGRQMTEPGGLRLANGIRRFFAAMSRRRPSFIRLPRRESSLNQGERT